MIDTGNTALLQIIQTGRSIGVIKVAVVVFQTTLNSSMDIIMIIVV